MSDITNESEVNEVSEVKDTKATVEVTTKPKKSIQRHLGEIVLIVVSVFAFRSVFFEPFRIPTGSMIPTLMIGDFILVNKMSYGFKVPFSDMFSDPIYITNKSDPKRGEIIVFKFPKDPNVNYIKRVVGLPGDSIELINKVLYVNGKKVSSEIVDGKEMMKDMDDKYKDYNLKFFKSKMGEKNHLMMIDVDNYYLTDHEKTIVPKGKFFVMGDNRDFSYDSRYWGFVPHENIKGKAILVWFSMIIPFLNENDFKFRPWRMGTILE